MPAQTEVRDYVIWFKHLHGSQAVADRVSKLQPGQTIQLAVDGVRGSWRRMDQGRDGRPTPGIRPLGAAQEFWRQMYRSRRGAVVSVEIIDDEARAPAAARVLGPTPEERQASLAALLAMRGQGWSSDGSPFDRDAAHER